MSAARLVTSAGGRRAALSTRPSVLNLRTWRVFSSAADKPPSNPFEIDLNALKTTSVLSTDKKLTLDDANRAAAMQQAEAQHEIDLLHGEMSALFGEDVAEYGGDRSSSSVEESVAAFEKGVEIKAQELVRPAETRVRATAVVQREQPPVKPKKIKEKKVASGEVTADELISGSAPSTDVLLLQGPCSFVRGIWTGGDMGGNALRRQVKALAGDLNVEVTHHDYNSEKRILEKLLDGRKDQMIVLCWNISLSKSPLVLHALELSQSRVIVVSPSNVEHGPLPANVVGVVSGFWNQSISLALHAATNVLGSNGMKKPKPQNSDTTGMKKEIAGTKSKKKKGSTG